MAHQQSPTIITPIGRRRVGLDPTPTPPAMHLIRGRWIASCPSCGCDLAQGLDQEQVERKAARETCPVCA